MTKRFFKAELTGASQPKPSNASRAACTTPFVRRPNGDETYKEDKPCRMYPVENINPINVRFSTY
jgi:hypothetical protein